MSTGPNEQAFQSVRKLISDVCQQMNIAEMCRVRLIECERELTVHFPVKMDDGEVRVLPASGWCTTIAEAPPKEASVTTLTSPWMR